MQRPSRNVDVRFELPDYKNEVSEELNEQRVVVEYDSNFGGVQTVEGVAERQTEWLSGGPRTYMVVDDRRVSNGYVFSEADGRRLGRVKSITVTMQADEAIEWVAKEWNGHDVDAGDDEIYVQFWAGLRDDMTNVEFLNHTDEIRFNPVE